MNRIATYLTAYTCALRAFVFSGKQVVSLKLILSIAFYYGISLISNAQIMVFAGDDTSICSDSNLDIESLQATIIGDVSDGNWFTTGDGIFLPSGNSMATYSTATHYIPGLEDMADGEFDLILVSDDPDGIGPMIEVSDVVTVVFQNSPAIACNNSINVTLDVFCEQLVTIDMLVSNPVEPIDRYIIEVRDENGVVILDNILTGEQIGQNVTYSVGHECTQVTCSGSLTVTDNFAPVFLCVDRQIVCDEGNTADEIGLPIPADAVAISTGNDSYLVSGWDACGDVVLSYTDIETIPSCNTSLDKIINRTWVATDANNNTSFCAQSILIERITVQEVIFPPHYDGDAEPSLSCDEVYDTDDNGNPSTSVTGAPMPSTCNHLDFIYSDTVIPLCGGGYKVLRAWEAIDWCLVETATSNQVIKVDDITSPSMQCVGDITISTSAYDCESDNILLSIPTDIQDCSDYTISAVVEATSSNMTYVVLENQNQYYVDNLPQGTYTIIYTVVDACDNSSSCSSMITVEDTVEPYIVCDQFTSTSITSTGVARIYSTVLDDGSIDNCEILSYEVAKMTDECGFGLEFGEFVDFCCEEVNDTVLVALLVTDASGNTNSCMVSVIVEDKISPTLNLPSDLIISCDTYYDLEDLSSFGVIRSSIDEVQNIIINDDFNSGVAGTDGFYNDNCIASVSETYTHSLDCYEGVISRTFTVEDEFGMSVSGTQTITISNSNFIQEDDIQWPSDIFTTGCQEVETDTSLTGIPVLSSVTCGAIAFEYYDEVFPVADSACIKILRHWTAIDWCQHDSNTGAGYWEYSQIIKLTNNVAPTISNCENVEICSYDDDCMSAEYDFDLIAGDDCTDTLLLQYSWELDLDQDGIINMTGNQSSIQVTLNHGVHRLYWTVSDACGNITSCDYLITVKDCKAPTPYCFSSITTVLMPTTGQVSIWASDFDLGSFDNCTEDSELQFSFSEDVNQTSMSFDCQDIENGAIQWLPLDMYVTDTDGNQDFCRVQIVIQDNDDACIDQSPDGIIKGNLRTHAGDRINGVEVEYKDVKHSYIDTTFTNEAGKYTSAATYDNVPYWVTPRKMDELTNGVTSLDLVLIQRHVLGFAEFSNPLQVIASDMNGSNSVSSADIVLLRKVVLGIKSELPNGDMPWRFIPEGYTFMDTLSPWGYDQDIYIEPLTDTLQNVDFTAIKLGDVNDSYEPFDANVTVENRNYESFNLLSSYQVEGNKLTLSLMTESSLVVDATQLSLEYDARAMYPSLVLDHDGMVLNEDLYHISNGIITIVSTNVLAKELDQNEALYSITFELIEDRLEYEFSLLDLYDNLIYENANAYHLTLENRDLSKVFENEIEDVFTLLSNPSTQCTIINNSSKSKDVSISIVDATGRVVSQDQRYLASNSTLDIDERVFDTSGIYYITIRDEDEVFLLEYIHLN